MIRATADSCFTDDCEQQIHAFCDFVTDRRDGTFVASHMSIKGYKVVSAVLLIGSYIFFLVYILKGKNNEI